MVFYQNILTVLFAVGFNDHAAVISLHAFFYDFSDFLFKFRRLWYTLNNYIKRHYLSAFDFSLLVVKQPRPVKRLRKVHTCSCIFEICVFAALEILIRIKRILYRLIVTVIEESNLVIHIVVFSFDRIFKRRSYKQLSVLVCISRFAHILYRCFRRPPERLKTVCLNTLPYEVVYCIAGIKIFHCISCSTADNSRRRACSDYCKSAYLLKFRAVYLKLIFHAPYPAYVYILVKGCSR